MERLRADPGSILHLYRRLLAVRRTSPALRRGDLELVDAPAGVLAYTRTAPGAPARAAAVNFGDEDAAVDVPRRWRVEVASDGRGEGEPWRGRLGAATGVVLAPA